ncbi:hypothetical protein Tco_0489987 [Tanacetum coccineum]
MNMPPTRAQQRSIICTYLKNMAGWKPKDLKNKSFANIQELFDKAFKRVNTFVDFRIELVKGIEMEESSKKAEQKVDDDQKAAKKKELMKIVPDEEEVAVDAIPLATKPPSIVGWKIVKEGKISYYQIIRADRSSKRYSAFIQMLRSFDKEDLETLRYSVEESTRKQKKGYPLTPATITDMLNKKLQADHWNEMCYQQFLSSSQSNSRINEGRIVGIKRLLDDLEVTAAQLMLLVYKLILLVFRVNAAGTKLQLPKDYNY